ncbi:MAG: hypothetical protein J1F07_06710 [Muribaculaceae bacterium]|nr:hypothetical protein [Muribaculaceae bacterium]
MKKYLKLLCVALFATMTFAFTACGDDDDEPDGAPSDSNLSSYYFTVNGDKFYYAYNFYSLGGELNSSIFQYDETSLFQKKVIYCEVKGFNKVINFDDITGSIFKPFKDGSGITEWAGFYIYLDYFDFNNAIEGQELKITDFTTPYNSHSNIFVIHVKEDGSVYNSNGDYNGEDYEWTSLSEINGKVTFVSFKENYLTLKFENIIMPEKDGSSSATLSGIIVFDTDNSAALP